MPSWTHGLNGEDTKTSAESSYTMQLRVPVHSSATAQHKYCPSSAFDVRLGKHFVWCWRDSPFLNCTHLVFDEIIRMGSQEATRPDSDEDCIRIGEFLLQWLCRALGQTEASFQFSKVLVRSGQDSNHAELRPTIYQTRSERSNPWFSNLGYMYSWGYICLSQGVHLLYSRNKLTLET